MIKPTTMVEAYLCEAYFFNLIGKTDFSMNQIHHTVLATTQSSFNVVYTVQSVGSYIDILI